MSFQIRPLREFLVRPAVPPELARLPEIGTNLMWSWHHRMRALFRRLDPVIWKASNHNPVVMLGRVPQEALERAAKDARYLALYRRACEIFDQYLAPPTAGSPQMLVAYFSMEYGLLDCMPIYSGGLGVLSGDHLKASSDSDLPLVGVGLLYQRGYFRQALDPDGWQQERTPVNDFYSLPLTPVERPGGGELTVSVDLAGTPVYLKVWRIDIGRVKLYLLDSNTPQNANPVHRDITGQLYAGDQHKRICQEIALGIGGVRALKELGLRPTLYHMNEGHSAFLAVERIRVLMAEHQLSFEEALEASRSNNIFTTHTSVPAGIDVFNVGLMHEYFEVYCRDSGISFQDFLGLGRVYPQDPNEMFSMAVTAFKTSAYRNAVSRLHRTVSQKMWDGLWPNLPDWEVPITSITNGVHLPSWINGDLAALYDQYLQPGWRDGTPEPKTWDQVTEIPDAELWEAHRRRKRRLVAYIRERAAGNASGRNAPALEIQRSQEALDPEALTIGFARRFATYKRANLIFRDMDRLKRILTNPGRPVQIVIAGKAHPQDVPGKNLIREIVQHSRDPQLARHIVFVEDYSLQVARELCGGVDVWLNTPRRGEEACGTSGMKAGLNGVLNMSILDGWFDEAEDAAGGWAIGDREEYSVDRDDAHAAAIYSLLENEIVPVYYEGRDQGVPADWLRRVKQSLRYVSANFDCLRMVSEYRRELYEPAHGSYQVMQEGQFRAAREKVRWSRRVAEVWPQVKFSNYSIGLDAVSSGSPVPIRAEVDLGGLTPEDVRVEALVGRVGPEGDLEEVQVLVLEPMVPAQAPPQGQSDQQHGTSVLFGRDVVPYATGRLGFAVRVSPNHFDDPLNRPCNALLKWADRG